MLIESKLPEDSDIRIPVPQEINPVVLEDSRKDYGRTEGSTNIPPFLRNTIAVAAHHDSNKNVARAFGISKQEVSLLKNAKVPDSKDEFGKDRINPNSRINVDLREAVEKDLLDVRQIATKNLLTALKTMTPERIGAVAKLNDVAHFADSMSRIVERTLPKTDSAERSEAKFVFIIPENRKMLSDYPVIEIANSLEE